MNSCTECEPIFLQLLFLSFLIISSASLFYIAKSPERSLLNVRVKRKTISVLLKAMDMHSDDPTMMRNGCLTLSQFKIPQDVVCLYFPLICYVLGSNCAKSIAYQFI